MANVLIDLKAAQLPVPVQTICVPVGLTITEIARKYHGSPIGLKAWVRSLNGLEEIPFERWDYVRPRSDHAVLFTYRVQGGGSGGRIFAAVAAIALSLAAPGIGTSFALSLSSAGVFFGSAAAFQAVAFAASSAVLIGGTIALQRLFPSGAGAGAISARKPEESRTFEQVSSDSNLSAKGAYLPVVIGGPRRVSPPDIMQPRPYIEDGIQSVERCLGFKGEHSITDIWIDGTPTDEIASITTETRDGNEASTDLTIIQKIASPVGISEQLSTFQLDGAVLEDQADPENSEPRFHYFSSPYDPKMDEIAHRLKFDSFATATSATQKIGIPIRLSCRPKTGGDWFNFPEIHFKGRDPISFVRDIRIRWDSDFGSQDIDGDLTFKFFHEVTEEDTTLSTPSGGLQWDSDDHFDSGGAIDESSFIFGKRYGLRIEVTEAVLPKAEYEWRIGRGIAYDNGDLNDSYQISGTIHSLFYSQFTGSSEWESPLSQGDYLGQVTILQTTMHVDEIPSKHAETALIGLKSKGQNVKNITASVARLVDDYNDGYFIYEADLRTLTTGGDDWTTGGLITGLRFDPSEDLADGDWIIDFIEITDRKGQRGFYDDFTEQGDWTGTNANVSIVDRGLQLDPTGADMQLSNTSVSIDGSVYHQVRIGMKNVDGNTSFSAVPELLHDNDVHGFSASYQMDFVRPSDYSDAWNYQVANNCNPATHYHQVLIDFLTEKGVDTDLIDDAAFVAWRTECEARGYKVSGVFAGESHDEIMYEIAVAGFARIVNSDLYSIDYFRDRSAEIPVQTFSARNSESIEANISYVDRPKGYRVDFKNKDTNWKDDEIFESIDNAADMAVFEPIEYKAIDDEILIRRRAHFDLLQVNERKRQWSISAFSEGAVCEKGNLISVITDIFNDESHGSRIRQVISASTIIIDQIIPQADVPPDFGDPTEPTVEEILDIGDQSIAYIQTPTGVEKVTIDSVELGTTNMTLRFSPPLSSTDVVGQHINIMNSAGPTSRVIVTDVDRKNDEQVMITAVDEAPQIFTMITEIFE